MLNIIKSEFGKASIYERFIAISLFFSPIAIIIHAKSGSVITGFLILSSLFFCWEKVSLNFTEKAFIASLLLFLIALSLSIFESEVIYEGWSRLGRYLKLLFLIPFYFLLTRIIKANVSVFLVYGSAVACVIGFEIALYDIHILEIERAQGEHHPIFFGLSMATFSLFILGYLVDNKTGSSQEKYFLVAAILFGVCACLMSGTRGAWLAYPVVLFIWLVKSRSKYVLVTMVVLLAIIVSAKLIIPDSYPFKRVNQAVKDVKRVIKNPKSCSSLGARINMWRNSIVMASSESWLIGAGLGDFRIESEKLIKQGKSKADCEIIYKHTAHSDYFHTLAESGLLGLGTWIVFLLIGFSLAYQTNLSTLFMICSFIVFGLSTTWLAKSLSIHTFIIYFIVSFHQEKKQNNHNL